MTYENASKITKTAMADALVSCMKDKPFDKITITDIVERCDLNRKTFYYHFADKNALLKWIIKRDAKLIYKEIEDENNFRKVVLTIFNYIEDNKASFQSLLNSSGVNEFREVFEERLFEAMKIYIRVKTTSQGIGIDERNLNFFSKMFTESIIGISLSYVSNNRKLDRAERNMLADKFTDTIDDCLNGIFSGQLKQ